MSKPFCRLILVAALALGGTRGAAAQELFISEYIEGSSNNKAIEIHNPGAGPVTLTGYSIQMFFNGSAAAGLTINLTGTVAPGDVHVIAHSSANAAILAQADQTNGSGWFNGDDAVVLRGPTGVIDVIGQIGVDPGTEWGSGLASTADNTLRRKAGILSGDPDGSNAFDPSAQWDGFAADTVDCLGRYVCGEPPATELTLCEIQGAGAASPHVGLTAMARANVVTAVGPQGFFIQIPDGLALAGCAPDVSRGLYVFTGSAPSVSVGQTVDVRGTVQEFFNLTELSAPTVTVVAGSPGVPTPIDFGPTLPSSTDIGAVPELERYEGMLVRVTDGLTVGPTDEFGDFSIVAGHPRPFREPGIETPGLPGLPVWDGNREIFEVNPNQLGGSDVAAAAGLPVSAEGPLSFDFGDYQIWPTALTVTGEATARPVRARQPGELTVATQNLLRLFDTVDDPDVDDEVADPAELAARLAKISALVRGPLGAPDVLVVQEVEALDVLQQVASSITADDPSLIYTPHLLEGNDIGGIDIGVLVRNTVAVDSVTQIGKDTEWEFEGAPQPPLNDRPPLVLRARYLGAPSDPGVPFPFVVIGVHQRSLNGIEGTAASARRVRQKRYLQAVELATAIQSLQQQAPAARLIVAGDFNAFEFTDGYVDVMGILTGVLDPAGALVAPPSDIVEPDLTNWTLSLSAEERYSFVFDGSAQSLDHMVTSAATNAWVRGVQHARGNADAPASLAADATTALRTSDHDGTVMFVMGDFDGDGFADDQDQCVRSSTSATVVIGGVDTGVSNVLFPNGCKLTDSIDQLAAAAAVHGDFVSGVTALVNDLARQGVIPASEKAAIVKAAAQSTIP